MQTTMEFVYLSKIGIKNLFNENKKLIWLFLLKILSKKLEIGLELRHQ
jgi:hypothetical protein